MKRLDGKMFRLGIVALAIEIIGLTSKIDVMATVGLVAGCTISFIWCIVRLEMLREELR